jgi:phage terminase large subunit-like protein
MDIQSILKNDRLFRVRAFENNFPLFFAYHFWRAFTNFQIAWMLSLQSPQNTYIEWFRASRKTTIVKWRVVWWICYKKDPYYIWQSYEDTLSWESVRDIAKMLFKKSIVRDYWMLFPLEKKKKDLQKASLTNFETKNWVKVASKSLGKTSRWANVFDEISEKIERPTKVIFDDIDVLKSVTNPAIIERNDHKIVNETMGAMDPLNRKVVFLGNTIYEDWVVPRFFNRYKGKQSWDCFRQPLIDSEWNNCRPEVFTDEVVQSLMDDWDIVFNQNYLLIPYAWQGIVKRHWIHYTNLKDRYKTIVIGADPAASTKTQSDPFGIVVCWDNWDWYKDIIMAFELKWEEKEKDNVIKFLFNLYVRTWANYIHFESVNAYSYLSWDLKKQWMAVKDINPHRDKVTRLMELEADIKDWTIRFVDWWEWIHLLINQMLMFPNWKHDDMVDAFVYSVAKKKKEMIVV